MHASWNILIKRAGQRIPYASQWVAIYCGIIAICTLPFLNLPDVASWPYLCASALLQAAYFFLLAKAYQYGDFSVAYPLMRGTAPLLVLVCGWLFLHESIDGHKIIGILDGVWQRFALLPSIRGLGKAKAMPCSMHWS